MSAEYDNALKAAHDEIDTLMQQRARLDERLSQLKATVDALTKLMARPTNPGEAMATDVERMGISDAIRQILKSSRVPLTPGDIKTALTARGFSLAGYANAGAVIHNTLKRLEHQGDITPISDGAGNTIGYSQKIVIAPHHGYEALARIGSDALHHGYEALARIERFADHEKMMEEANQIATTAAAAAEESLSRATATSVAAAKSFNQGTATPGIAIPQQRFEER